MPCDGNCYFGVCGFGPTPCDLVIRNVGREHFHTCEKHGVYWHLGSNLFSGWQRQTEEDWDLSREKLKEMTLVSEVHCDDCMAKSSLESTSSWEDSDDEIPF